MPARLRSNPHLLAHELRTPLSILGGWYSLIRDGDVSRTDTPEIWDSAMEACEQAVHRLNFIIGQACDETASTKSIDPETYVRMLRLIDETRLAIDHSTDVLARIRERRDYRRDHRGQPTQTHAAH